MTKTITYYHPVETLEELELRAKVELYSNDFPTDLKKDLEEVNTSNLEDLFVTEVDKYFNSYFYNYIYRDINSTEHTDLQVTQRVKSHIASYLKEKLITSLDNLTSEYCSYRDYNLEFDLLLKDLRRNGYSILSKTDKKDEYLVTKDNIYYLFFREYQIAEEVHEEYSYKLKNLSTNEVSTFDCTYTWSKRDYDSYYEISLEDNLEYYKEFIASEESFFEEEDLEEE